jgi:hypothetical protein
MNRCISELFARPLPHFWYRMLDILLSLFSRIGFFSHFEIAVLWNRGRWIYRRVHNLSDFVVGLVAGKKTFPMVQTLQS